MSSIVATGIHQPCWLRRLWRGVHTSPDPKNRSQSNPGHRTRVIEPRSSRSSSPDLRAHAFEPGGDRQPLKRPLNRAHPDHLFPEQRKKLSQRLRWAEKVTGFHSLSALLPLVQDGKWLSLAPRQCGKPPSFQQSAWPNRSAQSFWPGQTRAGEEIKRQDDGRGGRAGQMLQAAGGGGAKPRDLREDLPA